MENRTATIHRKTKETDIELTVNLDGSGSADVQTGVGFLDHMLDHLAKHSLSDLTVRATGDLQVRHFAAGGLGTVDKSTGELVLAGPTAHRTCACRPARSCWSRSTRSTRRLEADRRLA